MATLTSARPGIVAKILAAVALVAITAVGFVFGEVLLAGPIVFLVNTLGFGLGYVVFCLAWAGIGLSFLTVWDLFIGKSRPEKAAKEKPDNWRKRAALWLAGGARSLGTLAAAILLGPVFDWTVFKLLGYRKRDVYLLTVASSWIFGIVWVPFYGIGVWGFGLSRLF